MKRAIFLVLKFIVLHAVFLCIAGAMYYLYLQTTRIVAGVPMSFLPLSIIFPSLPFIFSCVSIASGFYVQVSCVRADAGIPAQITSALLVVAVWLAVIPQCAELSQKNVFPPKIVMIPKENVSAGFFRPYNGGVFFSTRGGNTVSGIFLQHTDVRHPARVENVSASRFQDYPYSDVLVANTINPPFFLAMFADEAVFFTRIGIEARRNGFFSWLCFASICLPFAAISSLARAGGWKLKNAVMMVFVFAGIVFLNHLYYTADVFQKIITPSGGFRAACNAITAAVIAIAGILGTVFVARKTPRDDE